MCKDFEEARWKIISRFPQLAAKQKKCYTCEYVCYIEDFRDNEESDYGIQCPCCGYRFRMRITAFSKHSAKDRRMEEKYARAL
jgi:transcription elongation factor Elf1